MWHLLNFIPTCAARRREEIDAAIRTSGENLELFAPTFIEMATVNGRRVPRELPLTFQYVFVNGTPQAIKQLCTATNGFSYVLSRSSDHDRHVTIDDDTLRQFRTIARAYSNSLPFYSLKDIDLCEGDRVEVVEGDFPGLQGIYIPNRRSNTGNLVLAVDQNLGTVIYDIKASYVRVLQFAPGTRREYDQIDAFVPRLLDAAATYRQGKPLTTTQINALTIFCRRMSALRLSNHKLDAKLQALLHTAAHILGDKAAETQAALRYARRAKAVTSTHTRALIHTLHWITGIEPDGRDTALTLLPSPSSKAERLLHTFLTTSTPDTP